MILSKQQINRYLRHIIMPEISGPGQKKITEARIFLYASTVDEASSLVYYLAASGIGKVLCFFEDKNGLEGLINKANDLNGDVKIEPVESLPYDGDFDLQIILFRYNGNNKDYIKNIVEYDAARSIPVIAAVSYGWRGIVKTFNDNEGIKDFLSTFENYNNNAHVNYNEESNWGIMSSCFIGAIASIESIKIILGLGTLLNKALYFNLSSMEFKAEGEDVPDILQALGEIPKEQEKRDAAASIKKLQEGKVLIVGTGGLGSPAAYALASMGVGTIGLVDYDSVEISNLNRQILHSVSKIGMPKVESAKEFIGWLNPKVNVVTYNDGLNASNAEQIIREYDIVVDAVDNFPARYLLNDACYFENKPLVDAAAVKFNGLILTIIPDKSACYRCTFPSIPEIAAGQSCKESGVLGPVPGVMGFLQAAEVIKLLSGVGEPLCNRIIYYDALDTEFIDIKMGKLPECELCGEHPTINTLIEYQTACESK